MNIPILILFFNRRDAVIALIEQLSKTKPRTIYLSCDGGRSDEEHAHVKKIRESVIERIDWKCNIHKNFNKKNLGCKLAVHTGIQWFFSKVPEGIILEDDCIPSEPFFQYVRVMLDLYREEKVIATIGGRNEISEYSIGETIFSSKFFCWGWASWADRVKLVDIDHGYKNKLDKKLFSNLSFYESQHIKGINEMMIKKFVDSWAYPYDFSFRYKGQLHIIPPVNYIKNIGFDGGVHSSKKNTAVDSYNASNERFEYIKVINPKKTNRYIKKYLISKYGFVKILFFPWIVRIKALKNFFSF